MLSIIIPVQKLKKTVNPRFFYKKMFGLKDTIDSIKEHIDVEFELIIVVNGQAEEDLINYLKAEKAISRTAYLTENIGVSRAWNVGAQMAMGEYLCFCNDDVEFKPESFSKLLKTFSDFDHIGEVGPEGGEWHLDKSGARKGLTEIEQADEISGYFFIIPTHVFYQTTGFDIFYSPAGCEEIDMSFQLRSMGYQCMVVPGTGILHHGSHGISSRNTDIFFLGQTINTRDLDIRNKEHFVKKWYSNGKVRF